MFDKLKDIQQKFVDVEKSLSDLAQISNPQRLQELSKLHAELSPIVSAYKDFQHLETAIEETETLLIDENDADMLALAQEELDDLKRQKDELTESLKMLLIPKDLNDEKNVIIEFVQALAERKLVFLLQRYFECTHDTQNEKVGKSKCSTQMQQD